MSTQIPRLLTLLLALTGTADTYAQRAPDAPPALREWLPWVIDDVPQARCPLLNLADPAQSNARVCAWPGVLTLDADARGARFSIRWQVEARSAVPLPGDTERWPQGVRANGAALAVVRDAQGRPVAWVDAGDWRIEGRFDWAQRPERLSVPDSAARIALTVDGARVFPLQREPGALWLGQPPSSAREADALTVSVFRLLGDGVPARLETVLQLQVAGQGREHVLERPLPDGFVPIGMSGELPARLDVDGSLRVQLRPGFHEVRLSARATAPLIGVARPPPRGDWPAQEVWSYAADGRLRITDATGGVPIDPGQAGVPADWANLPAFLLEAESALTIEERSRGLSPQEGNRLQLQRSLWLDFDGRGWTARDALRGTMVRDWRLDLAPPFTMTRAEADSEGLLVTRGLTDGDTGVELREHQVDVQASARIDGDLRSLPVVGWKAPLDAVSTTVHLPPGWRLYAAPGADAAPTTWLAQWTLLDLFLAALLVVAAFWALGPVGAAAALGFVLLGYREDPTLALLLMFLCGFALFLRMLPDGRLASAVRWARLALLGIALLSAFGFVAQQLRLAIHPQLERGVIGPGAYEFDQAPGADKGGIMAVNLAVPASAALEQRSDQLETIAVVGSRIKRADLVQRYSSDTLIQAGGGDPAWTWSSHRLAWSGPVLPTQQVRLVLSPPWLTRLLRVLSVLVLGVLGWKLVQGMRRSRRMPPLAVALAAAGLLWTGLAPAADFPPQSLLESLRERALQAPDCAPRCAHLAEARIEAEGDRIGVALEVHAAERSGVPVPGGGALLAVESITLDGVPVEALLRAADEGSWLVVDRGVHRVDIVFRAAAADRIPLRFPQTAARVRFSGRDWEAGGLRDGMLLTDSLDLVRVRASSAGPATAAAQQFPPFVVVERRIDFDLEWRVSTQVRRVAPQQAGIAVTLPLLAGERVATPGLEVADGRITVALQAGEDSVSWDSQLDRAEVLTLAAPDLSGHAEVWSVYASPTWNLQFQGLPAVRPADPNDWSHEFHPLPGESLAIAVARPQSLAGATLAIDRVLLTTRSGLRASTHRLELELRSTQGGQHAIALPAEAELLAVTIDGDSRNLRIDAGRVVLPLRPGRQNVTLEFRLLGDQSVVTVTPAVALGVPASNVRLELALPDDRWLLATDGPLVGPAVLYWPALVVLLIGAVLLARTRRTPLRLHDWLLLGLGFSTFSWLALLLVVAWLFALDLRARAQPLTSPAMFNLRQLGIAALSVIALLALLSAVPQGLLGNPDMQITGNDSGPGLLRWYADRSIDALPQAAAYSVSMLWYKLAMLAWALWLAHALVRWLRWGWGCVARDGYWQSLPRREPAPVAAAPPAPPPKPE